MKYLLIALMVASCTQPVNYYQDMGYYDTAKLQDISGI